VVAETYVHIHKMNEDDRDALFHGLWAVGPARHVAVHFNKGDPRRSRSNLYHLGFIKGLCGYVDAIVAGTSATSTSRTRQPAQRLYKYGASIGRRPSYT